VDLHDCDLIVISTGLTASLRCQNAATDVFSSDIKIFTHAPFRLSFLH